MKKLVVGMAVAVLGLAAPAGETMAWTGEALGAWTRGCNQCRDVRVEDGIMKGVVTGRDPQLYVKFGAPFATKGNHVVYLRLKTPIGGCAQLFWIREGDANASEDRQKTFNLKADGAWHDYRIIPDWHGDRPLVKLRLDLPAAMEDNQPFEIGGIRIAEEGACVDICADEFCGIAFSLKMPPGVHYCSIVWNGDERGCGAYYFSPATDGKRHDYWFDLRKAKVGGRGPDRHKSSWSGRIRSLRVEQTRLNRTLPVENLRTVRAKPDLPADLTVTSARPSSAIPRAGRPLELEVIVRNYGTRPAEHVRLALDGLPRGVRVLDPADLAPSDPHPGSEGHETFLNEFRYHCPPPAHERTYRIRLSDPGVGTFRCALSVAADGVPARRTAVEAKVRPSLRLPRLDYPAEPKPVDTAPYEIGALLFPGWDSHVWHTVQERAPWRKPVLGWYDETQPETIDWQIRQLVENGISFVSVDWYWSRFNDNTKLRHDWPTVFKRARYRKYLKWSVMWANHNWPGSHTPEDQENVTRFWTENYFCDPQYQTIDGMPVVTIYSPDGMERDMKDRGGCKALLEISQRVAKEKGYKGIYFIGMRGPDAESRDFLKKFEDWGFRRTCVYRYLGSGVKGAPYDDEGNRPYKWIADTSLNHWRTLAANSRIPFLPSLSTAWDNRPWCGEAGWAVTGYNVADFARVCRDAKRYSDESGERMLLLGPLDEWGEGEIGYPNAEHGFGILESVRNTFGRKPAKGWPVNYAPEDVGLTCPQKVRK